MFRQRRDGAHIDIDIHFLYIVHNALEGTLRRQILVVNACPEAGSSISLRVRGIIVPRVHFAVDGIIVLHALNGCERK